MLIYLDPSLIDYFRSGSASLMDYEVLDSIISSHRKRYHYVISTREGLEYLITLDKLSELCKRQLNMMCHDYSTVSRIVKQVATKIIVKEPQSDFKRIENSEKTGIFKEYPNVIFEIPLNKFLIPEMLDKTALISEHLDDCYFYEFLGTKFYKGGNLPISLSFQRIHGGGMDTYKLLNEKVNDNNIVFTIVDSDKKEPNSSLGKTSKKVVEQYEECRPTNIVGCEILPVHEKENLISPKIYGEIGNHIRLAALDQLNILCKSNQIDKLYPFLDLKKGLHSENYTSYFEEVFNIDGLIPKQEKECRNFDNEFIGTKEEFIAYCEEQRVTNKDERTIKYLIAPLSSNPLFDFNLDKLRDKFIQELQTNSKAPQEFIDEKKNKIKLIDNISDHLLEFQLEYFKVLGSQIREWGLCNPKAAAY